MPAWVGYPMLASRGSGLVLLIGGLSILTGYRMQLGARLLGAFVFIVTLTVHVPGVFQVPPGIPPAPNGTWNVPGIPGIGGMPIIAGGLVPGTGALIDGVLGTS